MTDLSLYEVDLDTSRPNPYDNTKVLRGDSPRTAFTKYNDALLALNGAIRHVGSLAPSPTVPWMLWLDTGVVPPVERQRNADNTAWVIKLTNPGLTVLGAVDTSDDLPTGATRGDAYVVGGTNLWVWAGTEWVDAGPIVGPEGVAGDPGEQGEDGEPGQSAYALAVEQGFTGTLDDWLESLKGDPGEPGEPGDPGPVGPPINVQVNGTMFEGVTTLILSGIGLTASMVGSALSIHFAGGVVPPTNQSYNSEDYFAGDYASGNT